MGPPYVPSHEPVERATALASEARRVAVVAVLRARPELVIDQLISLIQTSKYSDELGEIRIWQLRGHDRPPPASTRAQIEEAILRMFRASPDTWLASGFFVREFGVERWTAQNICGELAVRGILERRGRTSATRYRLACRRADERAAG